MRPIVLLCLLTLGVAVPARAAVLAPGAPLTTAFVEALVRQALDGLRPEQRFEIVVEQPSLPLGNAATLATDVVLEVIQYDATTGRFHGSLVGTFDDRERFRLPIFGRAYPVLRVPALNRPMAPEESITEDDLTWLEIAQANMPAGALTEPAEIIGNQARRRLAPGRLLTRRDVGPPHLVRRGRPVELIYARPGLRITALGVAQEDGALGDVVRVINAESRRQLQGVVSGPDEVAFSATAGR